MYVTLRSLDFTFWRIIRDMKKVHRGRKFKLVIMRVCSNIVAVAMAR